MFHKIINVMISCGPVQGDLTPTVILCDGKSKGLQQSERFVLACCFATLKLKRTTKNKNKKHIE